MIILLASTHFNTESRSPPTKAMKVHLPCCPQVFAPSFEEQGLWSKWSSDFYHLLTCMLLGVYRLTKQVNFELFKGKDCFIPFWHHHINSPFIPSQRCWIPYLPFLSRLHNPDFKFMITIFQWALSTTKRLTHIPYEFIHPLSKITISLFLLHFQLHSQWIPLFLTSMREYKLWK